MNDYVNTRLQELITERQALRDSEAQLLEAVDQIRNRLAMIEGGIQELKLIQQPQKTEEYLSSQNSPQDPSSLSHQS